MSPVKAAAAAAAAAACQITNFSKLKPTASSMNCQLLFQLADNHFIKSRCVKTDFEVEFFKWPTSQRLLNNTASNELPSPPL